MSNLSQSPAPIKIDPLSIVKLSTRPAHVDHRIDLNRYFAHTADGCEVELSLATWRTLFKAFMTNPLCKLVRTRVGLELAAEGDELLVRWLDPPPSEAPSARPASVEEAIEEMAEKGKAAKPALAKRLASAAELVRMGRVSLDGDAAKVGVYRVTSDSCECSDFLHRGGWCKHRLAARMARHLVAHGFKLPLPQDESVATPQISAQNMALIASGRVIDAAIRERVAYSQSSHGARDRALRMLGNGAKTLPVDLARRAGVARTQED